MRSFFWLLFVLIAIAVLVGIADVVQTALQPLAPASFQTIGTISTTFPQDVSVPTAYDQSAAQIPFQYLVSYTTSGFSPSSLSIHAGETVRFVNTTAGQIVLVSPDDQTYALSRGAYWEFTAGNAGSYTFHVGNANITVIAVQ
ncbi:MAG TPA: hypothetical protein VMU27_03295 [Candidatus Paceibacterota bacterium]|nr:hypothetical protein [Candidatus Paceibacterota bacterium]